MKKASKNYKIEKIDKNSYYMINKKGVKYLVENNIRYLGDNKNRPILEDLNYSGTPTITDVLGFSNRASFEDWLSSRAASYTNTTLPQAKLNFRKGSDLLEHMSQDWMKNRDVSVYGHADYIYESLHCGLYVSGEIHKTGTVGKWCLLDKLCKTLDLMGLRNKSLTVVDLGAGLGLTTLWMAYFLPNSKVYYVDASPESQQIVQEMCKLKGINNLYTIDKLEDIDEEEIDVATAFEFVEHIEDPNRSGYGMPFLGIEDVLKRMSKEGVFMYSTMWNAEQNNGSTIGHFLNYDFDGEVITMPSGKSPARSRKHHRLFIKGLKKRGFKLINGGRKGSIWDFKGHTPYCFVREDYDVKIKHVSVN